MSETGKELGMLLLGVAFGSLISSSLPGPLSVVQPYMGIIFFVLGIVLIIKG